MQVYEVRPRKDRRGVDLISDVLPFGQLWDGESAVAATNSFVTREPLLTPKSNPVFVRAEPIIAAMRISNGILQFGLWVSVALTGSPLARAQDAVPGTLGDFSKRTEATPTLSMEIPRSKPSLEIRDIFLTHLNTLFQTRIPKSPLLYVHRREKSDQRYLPRT